MSITSLNVEPLQIVTIPFLCMVSFFFTCLFVRFINMVFEKLPKCRSGRAHKNKVVIIYPLRFQLIQYFGEFFDQYPNRSA